MSSLWKEPGRGSRALNILHLKSPSSSLFALKGKPLGRSVAIQLPGKLFTDFEAWDPHNSQGKRPENRGPKYCHSSFDAITAGKWSNPHLSFLPFSSTPSGFPKAGVQSGGMGYRLQKSQVTLILHVLTKQNTASSCWLPLYPPVHAPPSAVWKAGI
jgi:hypothetical protein